jgi:hypothetical protein
MFTICQNCLPKKLFILFTQNIRAKMSLKSTQVYKSFDQAKLGFDGLVVGMGQCQVLANVLK